MQIECILYIVEVYRSMADIGTQIVCYFTVNLLVGIVHLMSRHWLEECKIKLTRFNDFMFKLSIVVEYTFMGVGLWMGYHLISSLFNK